jgi:hypothetical protein
MTDQPAYEVVIGEQFVEDYRRIAEEANRNPGGKADFLRKQIVREMSDLMSGHRTGITSSGWGGSGAPWRLRRLQTPVRSTTQRQITGKPSARFPP